MGKKSIDLIWGGINLILQTNTENVCCMCILNTLHFSETSLFTLYALSDYIS